MGKTITEIMREYDLSEREARYAENALNGITPDDQFTWDAHIEWCKKQNDF